MNLSNKIFVFEKARNKANGEVLERETRRKGHELMIQLLDIGKPLLYEYVSGGSLYTSRVIEYEFNEGELVVTTMNSVYTFKVKG